jgi:hypothetical protein
LSPFSTAALADAICGRKHSALLDELHVQLLHLLIRDDRLSWDNRSKLTTNSASLDSVFSCRVYCDALFDDTFVRRVEKDLDEKRKLPEQGSDGCFCVRSRDFVKPLRRCCCCCCCCCLLRLTIVRCGVADELDQLPGRLFAVAREAPSRTLNVVAQGVSTEAS